MLLLKSLCSIIGEAWGFFLTSFGTKEITPSPYQGEGWGGVKPGDITPTLNLGLFPYTLVLPSLSPLEKGGKRKSVIGE
jgi:hypothetical protein